MTSNSMTESKKLLYVFESGPYSTSAGLEALDAVLIGASFEQDVSLLFLNDGVFQLKANQCVGSESVGLEGSVGLKESVGLKQYTKTFKALVDFDVDRVFVHDLSMAARGLSLTELIIDAQALTSQEMTQLIAQQDKVFTF